MKAGLQAVGQVRSHRGSGWGLPSLPQQKAKADLLLGATDVEILEEFGTHKQTCKLCLGMCTGSQGATGLTL